MTIVENMPDTGLEVIDVASDRGFLARRVHTRNISAQMSGIQRLSRAFVDNPDTLLQELTNAAVELCGADSAGISIADSGSADEDYWRWVATAGQYSNFLHAALPRTPSACGICLERGTPQLFRVTQRFFDIMGVNAPVVTDGLLLPWHVDGTSGTIWIMSHSNTEAFDMEDCRMMQTLADFTAMAIRHQAQQAILVDQAKAAAAAAMAHDLAHKINNPLQSLVNLAYLAAQGTAERDVKLIGQELSEELRSLTLLVSRLLALPGGAPVIP